MQILLVVRRVFLVIVGCMMSGGWAQAVHPKNSPWLDMVMVGRHRVVPLCAGKKPVPPAWFKALPVFHEGKRVGTLGSVTRHQSDDAFYYRPVDLTLDGDPETFLPTFSDFAVANRQAPVRQGADLTLKASPEKLFGELKEFLKNHPMSPQKFIWPGMAETGTYRGSGHAV